MRLHVLAVAFCLAPALAQQWVFLDGPCAAGRGTAYDSRRSRAVIFGSEGETWEFDGTTRLHRPTSAGPFARSSHAMVYDAARGHVLMFGGRTALSLGDTWLWDGSAWQQPFSTLAPTRRSDAGIAFDSVRNRVVLFGGQDLGTAVLDDTWEHDGTQWLQRTPLTVPSPGNSPQLAFDAARNVTVLVLAPGVIGLPLLVFEWNGTDWTQRTSTTTPPSQRFNYTLSYDPLRQRTVLFGGSTSGNELWEWNGAAWQLMLANAPTAPINPGMYFDPALAATVIIGGQDSGWRTASWTWNGTTFLSLQPNHSPTSRYGYSLWHDTVRNRTVTFGGMRFQAHNDTWEWDGLRWTERTPATVPPARQDAMACFDPVAATGLLFGGRNGTTFHADCWRFDGTRWTQLPGPVPTTRTEGNMAWDPVRNEAILFGGLRTSSWLGDTWRCNGATWTQLATATAPSPRIRHAMAFDPVRGRMVLFGGAANGFTIANYLNDTWEWDGTQWQRVITAQSPPALLGACMVHDPVRGRMLLVGLNFISQPLRDLQAWEYDGSNWTLHSISSATLAEATQLTWDPVRQRAVLFDGTSVRELTATPAAADLLGTGCGAPPPALAARARPRTGENLFGLELSSRPNLPVVFVLGFGLGSTPIGNGCTLLVQQMVATPFVLAGGNGMSVLPVLLPPNHALRGLVVHTQALALDPAAPGGLALSAGLRINVGD